MLYDRETRELILDVKWRLDSAAAELEKGDARMAEHHLDGGEKDLAALRQRLAPGDATLQRPLGEYRRAQLEGEAKVKHPQFTAAATAAIAEIRQAILNGGLSGDETRTLAEFLAENGHRKPEDTAERTRRMARAVVAQCEAQSVSSQILRVSDAILGLLKNMQGEGGYQPPVGDDPDGSSESPAEALATTQADKEMVRVLHGSIETLRRKLGEVFPDSQIPSSIARSVEVDELKTEIKSLRERLIKYQATAESCEAQIVALRNDVAKVADALKMSLDANNRSAGGKSFGTYTSVQISAIRGAIERVEKAGGSEVVVDLSDTERLVVNVEQARTIVAEHGQPMPDNGAKQ